jgi:ribonuclease BN (tRNA processing enzyme)
VKVTVLGGSAAGVNTGAGCSAYLVETGTTHLVLDLGPGTLPELRRHTDFRTLTAIVISHMHLDHVLDLAALRYALAYNPVRPERRVPLLLPPNGVTTLNGLAQTFADEGEETEFFSSAFAIEEYDPARTVEIGECAIAFAPTVHYIPCWAMRIDANGHGGLGYTADTGPAAPLASIFSGVDVLISEATFSEPDDIPFDQRGHLTAREAGSLAKEASVRTLVLSHMWEEIGVERQRADASSVFGGTTMIARPGLVVETSTVRRA